jgi:cytochrome b561
LFPHRKDTHDEKHHDEVWERDATLALAQCLLYSAADPDGFAMTRMAEGPTQTNLYRMHVALGLLVLLLTAIRIIWRVIDPSPDKPAQIKGMRRLAFSGMHILQYLVLVLTLISGMGILLASGLGLAPANVLPEAISARLLPAQAHTALSTLFVLLLLAHVGGIIEYQVFHGNTLRRMNPFVISDT